MAPAVASFPFSRGPLIFIGLLAVLVLDFHYLQTNPSLELIAYINRITGVVTSATVAPAPTEITADGASRTLTQADIARAHQALPHGLGAAGGGRAHDHTGTTRTGADGGRHLVMKRALGGAQSHTADGDAAAAAAVPSALDSPLVASDSTAVVAQTQAKPNYRTLRFNAKSHMVFPIDLFVDYSTAYWLAVDCRIAELPFISANLISAIHPLVAFFAAYLIVKAAASGKPPGQGSTGASSPIELSHIGAPHSPVAGAITGHTVSPSHPSEQLGLHTPKHIGSTAAMVAAAAAAVVLVEDESKPLVARRGQCSVNITDTADDAAEKDKDWSQLFASVNVKYFRIAAACVLFRNILDTMDGIVARTQRANAIARGIHLPPPVTTVGFNGHTMDMVTDTFGIVAVGFAIHYVICTKTLTWHRIPTAIFKRIAPRLVGNKNQFIVKVLAWCGLAYLAVASSTWETFMIRYSNLFDVHANTNTAIFLLESNWHVRMTQMLWSFSCGDAMVFALIVMLATNRVWEGAQLMLLVGMPWQAVLVGYSLWVWQNVILANPVAAKIVFNSPELFP